MRFLLCFHIEKTLFSHFSLLLFKSVKFRAGRLWFSFSFFGAFLPFLLFCFIHFSTDCMELFERRKKVFCYEQKKNIYIYVQQRRSLIQCAYSRRMDCIENKNPTSEVSEQSRESSDCTRLLKKVFELS